MNDKTILLMIKGAISELPTADQKKIEECVGRMRALMVEYGDQATMAIALISAEFAAEQDEG